MQVFWGGCCGTEVVIGRRGRAVGCMTTPQCKPRKVVSSSISRTKLNLFRIEWPWAILWLVPCSFLVWSRFYNLAYSPGIYPDEANYLTFSYHLAQGRFQWGVFSHSFLPRLPLPLIFYRLCGVVLGPNLLSVRIVSALSNCLLALYILGLGVSHEDDKTVAIGSMSFLLIHPFVVCYSRWGFTYNIVALASVMVLHHGTHILRASGGKVHFVLLGLSAAMAVSSEIIGVIPFAWALAVVCLCSRPYALVFLALTLSPVGAYLCFLWLFNGDLLVSDVQALLVGRCTPDRTHILAKILSPLHHLWASHGWILFTGFLGLLLLRCRSLRFGTIIQLTLWYAIMVATAAEDYTLVVRQSIVLFPLSALGWGTLLRIASVRLHRVSMCLFRGFCHRLRLKANVALRKRTRTLIGVLTFAPATILALVGSFLLASAATSTALCVLGRTRWETPLDFICVENTHAMWRIGRFLSGHAEERDLVSADHLPVLLPCRRTSLMQIAVAMGAKGNPFFPYAIFSDRLLRDTNWHSVDYVVLTPYNFRIEHHFPGVHSLLRQIMAWPVLYSVDMIEVRINPRKLARVPGDQI